MLCSICQKKEANIHLEGMVNGKTLHLHLCEDCAKKRGIEFSLDKPNFSLVDLLANLSDWEIPGHKTIKYVTCPNCGLSYKKFKETARLGCSKCYDSFEAQLTPLLKRIHGSAKHIGKKPEIHFTSLDAKIDKLKQELSEAIKKEEFEKAAEIRDKIKAIRKNQNKV
ncbi:MAG: UvrB/UvrC motif-containing protein [Endomicrobiales bacterium]|nr:UvrB/UvrC motif-containing protein [Endomicrobiales bacterium]